MTRAHPAPLDLAIAAQQRASDPAVSAFVDANAGAGKTAVLTARVARLLLAGAEPSKILCITYTKAAAAEMADRLLKMLGEWALADDATLAARLGEIEGPQAGRRGGGDLARARALFARALETPGGLKIGTIHSFCESVLRRFPLEAGAAPGFTVLDDKEARALAGDALNDVMGRADVDPCVAAPLQSLTSAIDPTRLEALLIENTVSRQKIGEACAAAGGFGKLRARLAQRFRVVPGETPASIRAAAAAGVVRAKIVDFQAALRSGGPNGEKIANGALADYLKAQNDAERFDALYRALFTLAGAPRKHFPDAKVKQRHPWTEGFCGRLARTLGEAETRAREAQNGADTIAFLTLLEKAMEGYARLKEAQAGLDYDDLIEKTSRLFAAADGAWVRYKLDQGVDHILLDEAQDTSPEQWRVVEAPLGEFFAGEGARPAQRTFFAVGDQKQSIYSFQGADAELFQEKLHDLGKTISAAAQTCRTEPLRLSFRSAAPILEFVDALYADSNVLAGVGAADETMRHELNRVGAAGAVELWPLVPRDAAQPADAWDVALDAILESDPRRILANALADELNRRIGDDMLLSRGRPLRASDVLILVQNRGPLFHEVLKALARRGVPVAGADRIRLLEEPAVEDVLSVARAVLLYSDDLSLAEALRSPFFRIDDSSLYDLAQSRPPEERLRATLRRRAAERPEWAEAEEALVRAERIALDKGAFAFVSHLLEEGAPSGREKLFGRLSPAAAEPLNELLRQTLDYERRRPRSLQGFVNWLEGEAQEVKRDPDLAGDAVRVMTVHGAKGLQANMVVLLDAHRPPRLSASPLFFEGVRGARSPVLSRDKDRESEAAREARAEARRRAHEEHRRLLYVAATRARDRLVICGVQHGNAADPHKKPPAEKSWHALAEDAFARLHPRADRDAPYGGAIRVIDCPQNAKIEREDDVGDVFDASPPSWLKTPAAPERRTPRLSPSRLGAEAEAIFSPRRPRDSLLRGRTLHRLIELLPQAEDSRRDALADRLLAQLAPGIAAEERARWRDEALAVVRNPQFAPVFSPMSRAEVAVAGTLHTARGDRFVSGQIDRLAFDGGRILVIDYKTNRPPPKSIEDAPEAYAAQLAAYRALLRQLYPEARIEAALLWTYEARLMTVPDRLLDEALASFLEAA
ncbi:MAG: double-strand break repair helicase AddA [Parvularculaceae bacterium]|nr:double-strand break repair helicase AddA [Parvularculaceae bacterium]